MRRSRSSSTLRRTSRPACPTPRRGNGWEPCRGGTSPARLVSGQFHLPLSNASLPHAAIDTAAAVLAFDFLIGNDDRHREKANCLVKGDHVVVIDHERAFPGLRAELRPHAWQTGGLAGLSRHVFYDGLRGQMPDFSRFEARLSRITSKLIDGYLAEIPVTWADPAGVGRLREFLFDLQTHHSRVIVSRKEELRR